MKLEGSVLPRQMCWVASVTRCVPVFAAVLGLSACAVGSLSTTSPSAESVHHEDLQDRAAEISNSRWGRLRASGSHLGSFAAILMEGRDAAASAAPAASASSGQTVDTYLERKAAVFNTHEEQLSSVIEDVQQKTAEIDTFIQYAEVLAADYHRSLEELEAAPDSPELQRKKSALMADRRVLDRAVVELRGQKISLLAVERKIKEDEPELDTSRLSRAMDSFAERINKLIALARSMGEKALG